MGHSENHDDALVVSQFSTVVIRRFNPDDSIKELTALLRRAYQQLADQGLRYTTT